VSSLNQVTLIGRVGRDPELRRTAQGTAITNMSLATSETWKDKQTGEKKEATEWHRVVFYDRQAEVADQYAKKGALILVQGSLKTRKWTDKDGVEKYTTEIQARELKLLSRPSEGGGSAPAPAPRPLQKAQQGGFDGDIPF
jgi:single-strand DNA-binding protein